MFHIVCFIIGLCLVSVPKLSWDIQFEGTDYVVRERQSLYACGVPGRGASAMWSMVGDATSCEVLGVIA